MGMPCQVNSILKLKPDQGYPPLLAVGQRHTVEKAGYRIFPLDVPLCLVDEHWLAHADIVIQQLRWVDQITHLTFTITRLYDQPFAVQ